jgi:hypothetical protein
MPHEQQSIRIIIFYSHGVDCQRQQRSGVDISESTGLER